MRTVSYTHLDVYKRQVTEFLDFARPLHAEPRPADLTALLDRVLQIVAGRFASNPVTGKPCLLYTSRCV